MTPTVKVFEAGKAYAYGASCPNCPEFNGLLIKIISLTMEERIEARCGKLLLTECDRCGSKEYCFREGNEDLTLIKWNRVFEREDKEKEATL